MNFESLLDTTSAIHRLIPTRICRLLALTLIASGNILAQTSESSVISGRVSDSAKAIIVGAEVILSSSSGSETKTATNSEGGFRFVVRPGKYSLQISSNGFAQYRNPGIDVALGRNVTLDVTLNVGIQEAQVVVSDEPAVSTDPESNAGAVVLKAVEIEALPDDHAELEAALQALTGPGAGPNGGEIFVDGFSGGKLPPRDSIKEIRINQNPFSSEFSRMGLGRIEVITKPGSEKWNGELVARFEDESLNSRNPYSSNRPPFQVRSFEGNLGGTLKKDRISFFLDAERKATDNNALVNAQILDANLNTILFQKAFLTPSLGIEVHPRFDLKLSDNNSLAIRFGYERDRQLNGGLGGFDLPTRAFDAIDTERYIRLTDTAVINTKVLNELRIQYMIAGTKQKASSNIPTLIVNDAFTSGGANTGDTTTQDTRFELTNNTSFLFNKHLVKAGVFFRRVSVSSRSPSNFAGTFTFSSIDQYRNTLLNLPGAFPTQFSIAGGNPVADISVVDYAGYVQDDWKLKPSVFTLSLGIRYENQTGISDSSNLAPRIAFAYSPGPDKHAAKFVIRGGVGIFYERFGRYLLLQAKRYNGLNQQQYIVTDPIILDSIIFTASSISNVPSVETLSQFALVQTIQTIAPDLKSPVYFQSALSIERQLPRKTTISLSYVNTALRRQLRSKNVNAPLNGVRPRPDIGNIFQYESSGRYNQNQLIFNFKSNFSEKASVFGNYSFGGSKSDTDGPRSFPGDPYDLSNEYGSSAQDIRHRFALGGSYEVAYGIKLSPLINFRSGVPFNITTGTDSNGDTLFTERPTYQELMGVCFVRLLTNSFCRLKGEQATNNSVIPRNFGRGSSFLGINLNAAKEFGFAKTKDDEARYKLEISMQVRNIFNRTNKGTPVGNIRSDLFGEPTSTAGGFGGGSTSAGNRRITLGLQFSF